ncbi:IS66 family insertion sequence element accessory protein TnpB [Methylobacterium mesophilicum]|uniref:IS66 family insertion sequence element accessory protein TnpB n=1 Tax=Methylobacterium mesophilicum TaxID=39956 RepID=UPI0032AEC5B1
MAGPGHTDLRKGFDRLAALAQDHLHHDPFSGQALVFRGRAGRLIKVLWWDGQGLCLFSKRLAKGRFVWRGLQGPRRRSHQPNSRYCWRGSTGGRPSARTDRASRAEGRCARRGCRAVMGKLSYWHGSRSCLAAK